MKTGAIICAAGLSSRMQGFKPMLPIGGQSMIRLIVNTFYEAGISPIAVVTGYHAAALRDHLSETDVIFVHNERFATTHMFDSFLLGMNAIADSCSRFFFTPADIPLFHARTLKALQDSLGNSVAIPVFHGQSGHPVLIDSGCIPYLRKYKGEGGLRGAFSRLLVPPKKVTVDDECILYDADNAADYYCLLKKQQVITGKATLQFELSLQLMVTEPFFSFSTAQLLGLIDQTGCIQTAESCMHLSKGSALKTVVQIEQQLGYRILLQPAGEIGHSVAQLTVKGRQLLKAYLSFYSLVQSAGESLFADFFRDVTVPVSNSPGNQH